jgi:hypothetical protein
MADALKIRLSELEAKRRARTDHEGKPRKGYELNLPALDKQIAKIKRKIEHADEG